MALLTATFNLPTQMGNLSVRDVKQIAATPTSLVALCDDGTMWMLDERSRTWTQIPPIPGQPGAVAVPGASVEHDEMVLARQEQAQRAIRERFEGKR